MCELYAASSAVAKKISFSLHEFRRHGGITGDHVDGWGLAFYNLGEMIVHRETKPAALSLKMDYVLKNHQPSDTVISHIRKATQGNISLENTQPFSMEKGGINHIFAHNGNLENVQENIPTNKYTPKGETDSEYAFCYLMEKLDTLYEKGVPSFEQKVELIKDTFNYFSSLGPANFIYSDGEYVFAFGHIRKQSDGSEGPPGLYYLERDASTDTDKVKIPGMNMVGFRQDQLLLASVPLTDEHWVPFKLNQLVVAKFGRLLYSSC